MKLVNQYIIPIAGLKEGYHEFTFDFRKEFFDAHNVLEARDGNIIAKLGLTKRTDMLSLKIRMSGFLEIKCDRCLEYFQFPIVFDGNLVIKFGENKAESTDEIWILYPSENTLDLEQYFFECVGLCIPIKRIHPENKDGVVGCDPKMIEMLETHSKNSNLHDESDPRWSKLKDMLNDLNNN